MSSPASSLASQAARDRVGRVLRDKWHLDEVIGTGGFSAVYAATHRTGKRVAIKILNPELSAIETARSRFLREAYAVNAVEHPGMVSIVDDDVDEDGCIYLVMDLLEGETLEERRQRAGGSLDFDDVLSMGDDVLDILAAAHEKGVIHRDLKPENVFICKSGQIKLLDFGVAKLRETPHAKALTVNGIVIGTPAFMPPEQARGQWDQVDERSDLWAMGATMFTLLTGQLVHGHLNPHEALIASVSKPAPSLDDVSPGAPRSLVAFMARALAFDRANRFQSAREMQHAVRSLLSELSTRASVRSKHLAQMDNEPTHQDDRKKPSEDGTSVTRPLTAFVGKGAIPKAIVRDLQPPLAPTVRELESLFDSQASSTDLKKVVRDAPPPPAETAADNQATKEDDKTLVRPSKPAPSPSDDVTQPSGDDKPRKEKRSRSKANAPAIPQNKIPMWGWAVLILLTIFIILMALLLLKEMKRPRAEVRSAPVTMQLPRG